MGRTTLLGVAAVAAAVLGPLAIWSTRAAESAESPPPTTRPTTAPAATAAGQDVIAAGDLLVVYYPDLVGPGTDYARPARVGAGGVITVPHTGELKVAGLTLRAAEQAIGTRLREARVVEQARVSVDRQERAAAASVGPGPIAPGDVLRVSVLELLGPGREQVRRLHVSDDGGAGLPLLGQTRVAGMTEAEAEAAVSKAYQEAQLVDRAVVSVLRVKPPAGPEPIPPSVIPVGRPK